ncbi:hypothetical protein pipiens_016986 [Culex pipiens pipiens]|uniref:Uncharacterized protein n=1 Tax=Culex pipiens pipiens TaxID=38569 RepID=A0ABD1CIW5_CULPP
MNVVNHKGEDLELLRIRIVYGGPCSEPDSIEPVSPFRVLAVAICPTCPLVNLLFMFDPDWHLVNDGVAMEDREEDHQQFRTDTSSISDTLNNTENKSD